MWISLVRSCEKNNLDILRVDFESKQGSRPRKSEVYPRYVEDFRKEADAITDQKPPYNVQVIFSQLLSSEDALRF